MLQYCNIQLAACYKSKKIVRVDKKCHIGRTYDDFEAFMKEHPDFNVVEMDSVEGSRDSTKVLLTLFFRNCSLMLAYLREACLKTRLW